MVNGLADLPKVLRDAEGFTAVMDSLRAGGAGTIMSYCNIGGCAGTQNLLQFNATQITKTLTPAINSAASSCFNDVIFRNGFE